MTSSKHTKLQYADNQPLNIPAAKTQAPLPLKSDTKRYKMIPFDTKY